MNLFAQTTGQILISYSRRDRDTVLKLYADLKALGFKLWRDLHDIEGGEPFWEEIKKGIDGCETVVLCLSSDSPKSEFVQKEWHYARQQGKRVIPVVVADIDFATLPRWMGRVDWKDFREGQPERDTIWASFIRTLNTKYEGRKVPFMADKLPEYFVPRPDEFDSLLNALVNANGAVAITAAVKGAGGFGKTTLAMALCHDHRVRGAFDDGILWVTLGEKPTEAELLRKVLDLVYEITGQRPQVEGREAAKSELAKAIGDRYMLLVIDDLWRKVDVDWFLSGAKNSAVLITTRFDAQLPEQTRFKQNVDAMRLDQAVKLLTWNIQDDITPHKAALEALARRLGEWAVLLRLVNATLHEQIDAGETLAQALVYADTALTRKGLAGFDSENPNTRAEAVRSTIGVSLELLNPARQAQFARLAIFPEDVDVPFTTLEKLWGLDDFDTAEVAKALNKAALLLNFELAQKTIRLHDVVRQYLVSTHKDQLGTWQQTLVQALDIEPPQPLPRPKRGFWQMLRGALGFAERKPPLPTRDYTLPDEYCWRNLAYHLIGAGQAGTLYRLLTDPVYLDAKLKATDVDALIADGTTSYDQAANAEQKEVARLLISALQMSAHVLTADKTAFAHQVVGRLMTYRRKSAPIKALTDAIMAQVAGLYPPNPDSDYAVLEQAGGALLHTLIGHTHWVTSAGYSADGCCIVSASADKTVRVWHAISGELLCTLIGHTETVLSAGYSADRRYIVSASHDKTVRVWESISGALLHTLTGHKDVVTSARYSADGRFIVSASHDKTVRVWEAAQGAVLLTLTGHTGFVHSAVYSPDGRRIVSSSDDNTVRVWDATSGDLLCTLTGHTATVNSAAYSANGRYIVSASKDGTVRVWDATTSELLHTLTGHTGAVNSAAYSTDGRYIVSAADRTVRMWDATSGELLHVLRGHTGVVMSAAFSPDGSRLVSSSFDYTVRVWNATTGELLHSLTGHTLGVKSVKYSANGRYIVSASEDGTVQVWDATSGKLRRTLNGHMLFLNSAVYSPDGRNIVSVSGDNGNTVQVWDATSGKLRRTLNGDILSVHSAVYSPDGRCIVSAGDTMVQVWDATSGKLRGILMGHTSSVYSVGYNVDGRHIVTGSLDSTVRVWDATSGELLHTLTGHTSAVISTTYSANGYHIVSVSWDGTVRVWNAETGQALAQFERNVSGYAQLCQQYSQCQRTADFDTSASGQRLVWAGLQLSILSPDGTPLARFYADGHIRCCAWSPDGVHLVAGDESGRVLLLRWHEGKVSPSE